MSIIRSGDRDSNSCVLDRYVLAATVVVAAFGLAYPHLEEDGRPSQVQHSKPTVDTANTVIHATKNAIAATANQANSAGNNKTKKPTKSSKKKSIPHN